MNLAIRDCIASCSVVFDRVCFLFSYFPSIVSDIVLQVLRFTEEKRIHSKKKKEYAYENIVTQCYIMHSSSIDCTGKDKHGIQVKHEMGFSGICYCIWHQLWDSILVFCLLIYFILCTSNIYIYVSITLFFFVCFQCHRCDLIFRAISIRQQQEVTSRIKSLHFVFNTNFI